MPPVKSAHKNESKNLGVLFASWVEKKNPYSGAFKKRFLVLTHDSLHWFLVRLAYSFFAVYLFRL